MGTLQTKANHLILLTVDKVLQGLTILHGIGTLVGSFLKIIQSKSPIPHNIETTAPSTWKIRCSRLLKGKPKCSIQSADKPVDWPFSRLRVIKDSWTSRTAFIHRKQSRCGYEAAKRWRSCLSECNTGKCVYPLKLEPLKLTTPWSRHPQATNDCQELQLLICHEMPTNPIKN